LPPRVIVIRLHRDALEISPFIEIDQDLYRLVLFCVTADVDLRAGKYATLDGWHQGPRFLADRNGSSLLRG
jgi:hypothetical protein